MRFISRSALVIAALTALTACGGSDDEPAPPTTIEEGDGSDAGTDGSDEDKDADPSDDEDSGAPDGGDDEGDGGTDGGDTDAGDTDGGDDGTDGGETDGGETDGGDDEETGPAVDCESLTNSKLNTSVTLGADCYYVGSDVTANAKITINAGVTVYLAGNVTLDFPKGLTANATEDAKVRFLAADETKPYASVKLKGASWLQHVEFKGGGAGTDTEAMFVFDNYNDSGNTLLHDIVFDDGHGKSCFSFTGNKSADIENLAFVGCENTTYTLSIDAELLKLLTPDFDYGTQKKVLVNGYPVYGTGVRFRNVGVVYIVKGGLSVKGGDLKVEAGVEIQVDSSNWIEMSPSPSDTNKYFEAIGTEDQPIVFKAGPSNKWLGLKVVGARGNFQYVHVDGAKGTGTSEPAANITAASSSIVNVHDSRLTNSAGYGLYKMSGATLNQTNNTFEGNALGDELRN